MPTLTNRQAIARKLQEPLDTIFAARARELHRQVLLSESPSRRMAALAVQVRLELAESFGEARKALREDLGRDVSPGSNG
jgi:hypothetical protein